jgi:hypothetical protein
LNCSEELEQARKNKPLKGYKTTVENIEVLQLTVNWLCRANFGSVKPQVIILVVVSLFVLSIF